MLCREWNLQSIQGSINRINCETKVFWLAVVDRRLSYCPPLYSSMSVIFLIPGHFSLFCIRQSLSAYCTEKPECFLEDTDTPLNQSHECIYTLEKGDSPDSSRKATFSTIPFSPNFGKCALHCVSSNTTTFFSTCCIGPAPGIHQHKHCGISRRIKGTAAHHRVCIHLQKYADHLLSLSLVFYLNCDVSEFAKTSLYFLSFPGMITGITNVHSCFVFLANECSTSF